MRALPLLAVLLVAATLPALAPEADARAVCSRAIDGAACPGYACQWRQPGHWSCEKDVLESICIRCWGPEGLP